MCLNFLNEVDRSVAAIGESEIEIISKHCEEKRTRDGY